MIEHARSDELSALAALAAIQQRRDDRFMIYCGEEATTIEVEVAEVEDWPSSLWTARRGSTVVGWLLAEVDDEIGRVWWWGPFLDVDGAGKWAELADELYLAARAAIGDDIGQEEMAFDDRHHEGAALAARYGFATEPASCLLSTALAPAHVAHSIVRSVASADHEAVISLHEELFANAHLTGRQLVEQAGQNQFRSVALVEDRVVGYVATEMQPDGNGLIDFVGVAPSAQRQGVGRDLVAEAVGELQSAGASRCFLTVRENNAAARRLYASLGFEQERMLRPFRKGFTLG